MHSKILEGVKPFNDFWFKSCYYHQLIAGLSILNIDGKDILLNDFAYLGKDFSINNDGLINEKLLSKSLGYKAKHVNITKKMIIKNIDKGHPIIVGVDCYYLEPRKDTYKKMHVSHFILVYGYNKLNNIFNIVDHNYLNDYAFKPQEILYTTLLKANEMYKKGICKAKTTSVILKKKKKKSNKDLLSIIIEDKNQLIISRDNLEQDFIVLAEIFSKGAKVVELNYDKIVLFIEKMKSSRLSLSRTRIMKLNDNIGEIIKELQSAYIFFTAVLWKMKQLNDFSFGEKKLEKILRKIEVTKGLENSFFNTLIGEKYEFLSIGFNKSIKS